MLGFDFFVITRTVEPVLNEHLLEFGEDLLFASHKDHWGVIAGSFNV